MTTHYFSTKYNDEPVRIQTGWDRPLGGYYLVIERLVKIETEEDEDNQYVYSNLSDPGLSDSMGMSKDLDYFSRTLDTLGISIPADMLSEVRDDGVGNVGNRVVHWPLETKA